MLDIYGYTTYSSIITSLVQPLTLDHILVVILRSCDNGENTTNLTIDLHDIAVTLIYVSLEYLLRGVVFSPLPWYYVVHPLFPHLEYLDYTAVILLLGFSEFYHLKCIC